MNKISTNYCYNPSFGRVVYGKNANKFIERLSKSEEKFLKYAEEEMKNYKKVNYIVTEDGIVLQVKERSGSGYYPRVLDVAPSKSKGYNNVSFTVGNNYESHTFTFDTEPIEVLGTLDDFQKKNDMRLKMRIADFIENQGKVIPRQIEE